MSRKLVIDNHIVKIKDSETVFRNVVCPFSNGSRDICFCSTDCAWFSLVEEYGIPLRRNVILCQKNVIGQLE